MLNEVEAVKEVDVPTYCTVPPPSDVPAVYAVPFTGAELSDELVLDITI